MRSGFLFLYQGRRTDQLPKGNSTTPSLALQAFIVLSLVGDQDVRGSK